MARSVPLSRFTSQFGGGSAFFVRQHSRHENIRDIVFAFCTYSLLSGCRHFEQAGCYSGCRSRSRSSRFSPCGLQEAEGRVCDSLRWRPSRVVDFIRATSSIESHKCDGDELDYEPAMCRCRSEDIGHDICQNTRARLTMLPNKSPEPTAVGACSSAIAVHAASRRWLSFFR